MFKGIIVYYYYYYYYTVVVVLAVAVSIFGPLRFRKIFPRYLFLGHPSARCPLSL
jgi:hypothetical protein